VAVAKQVPAAADEVVRDVSEKLGLNPDDVHDTIADPSRVQDVLPGLGTALSRIGGYSASAFTILIVLISVWSMVTYAVVSPHRLLRGYLRLFPRHLQEQAARAYQRSAQMITAWLWSNLPVGAIEAVIVALVLPLIGVPYPLLWAALALFAEMIPKLGGYLMSIPPILLATGQSPTTGLITLVFYVALLQIMGNVVEPPIRGRAMEIHPAVLMFAVLAMASGFGFLGAFIATPVAGIAAAFVEQFVISRQGEHDLDTRVSRMLKAR
jgi:putative permease